MRDGYYYVNCKKFKNRFFQVEGASVYIVDKVAEWFLPAEWSECFTNISIKEFKTFKPVFIEGLNEED